MTKNSILIDIDDARSEAIAEVLSNKTSKKILSVLVEGEKSASDIATKLELPLNTVSYNLKKLVEAGLVERSKGFFWSSKGKKMEIYKVANKKIIITPKQIVKGVIPVLIFIGLATFGVKLWTQSQIQAADIIESFVTKQAASYGAARNLGAGVEDLATSSKLIGASKEISDQNNFSVVLAIAQSAWLWFLVGALFALFVYFVWNWRRQ